MTENEAISILSHMKNLITVRTYEEKALEMAIQALEEVLQYRAIGTPEKILVNFNDGATTLEQSKEVIEAAMRKIQEYESVGTVEEIKEMSAELKRWHTSEINPKIRNTFANTSTQICHNCDHKDEYIEELEEENAEYKAIGTIDECQSAVERMKPKKPKKPIDISMVRDNNGYIGLIGKCPCCDDIVEEDTLYCDCGQKLDWEKKE